MENKETLEKVLSLISPGTEIRKGIENILSARTGALILVEETKNIDKILDGGFEINCDYNPQKIYELAKMDGAIVLNKNMDKILYANVQLQADARYKTRESGTRHRTAERIAKQTGNMLIAISERRGKVTIYKEEVRYSLRKINDVINEANQAIKTLERYKTVLNKAISNLTIMEYDDLVTLYEVTMILQRFGMLFRIAEEIQKYILELGIEGRLIKMQLDEILIGVEEEMKDLIKDYQNDKKKEEVSKIFENITLLTQEELLEVENIAYNLGYSKDYKSLDNNLIPKGYRLLSKVFKLTSKNIENVVEEFGQLNNILEADAEKFAEIKGIGKFKAKSIKNGLSRLKVMTLLEK